MISSRSISPPPFSSFGISRVIPPSSIALGWEYWTRTRRWIVPIAILLDGFIILLYYYRRAKGIDENFSLTESVVMFQVMVSIFLAMAQFQMRSLNLPGYPIQWHLLPMSTGKLVAHQMAFSVGASLAVYGVNLTILHLVIGLPFPSLQFVGVLIASALIGQMMSWCFPLLLFLAPFVYAALSVGVVFWMAMIFEGAHGQSIEIWPGVQTAPLSWGVNLLITLSFVGGAWMTSYIALTLDRRNNHCPGLAQWLSNRSLSQRAPVSSCSKDLPPFKSPWRSQFWMFWRMYGVWVSGSFIGLILLAVLILPILTVEPEARAALSFFFLGCLVFIPFGYGSGFGMTLGHEGFEKGGNGRFSPFCAVRPISNSTFSSVILSMFGMSIALIVLITAAASMRWGGLIEIARSFLLFLEQKEILYIPDSNSISIFPILGTLLTILSLMWTLATMQFAATVNGRMWLILGPFFIIAAMIISPLIVRLVFWESEIWRTIAWINGWITGILVALGAIAAYITALRQGHLPIRGAILGGMIWITLVILFWILLRPILSLRQMMILILILPGAASAPLAAVPMALHWNRHGR